MSAPIPREKIAEAVALASEETSWAVEHWPRFNSAHEAFAILMEEVDELWEHVKTNQKRRDIDAMKRECIQVAAMAIRFAAEICNEKDGRK
jgi:NTP pyrophosphatase (non-canonical NTP hydrolase)